MRETLAYVEPHYETVRKNSVEVLKKMSSAKKAVLQLKIDTDNLLNEINHLERALLKVSKKNLSNQAKELFVRRKPRLPETELAQHRLTLSRFCSTLWG